MKPANLKKNQSLLFLLLLFSNYFLSSTAIKAQSTLEGLSAIPPRLEVTVKADDTVAKTIKVRNESSKEKNISLTITDFVVNDDIGTPTFISASPEDNRWAASNWLSVSPSTFKLKGGETRALSLIITPPANALPGGHYAAVISTPDPDISILNSTGATVQTKVGTLVYVTIPGNIVQNAIIKNFNTEKFYEFGPIDFDTTIQNLSDIHIKPVGSINITNFFGKESIIEFNKEKTNIFPGKTRDFENQLNKKWLFGRFKAELKFIYGTDENNIASAFIYFWVIPWRLIILITAAAVIIVTATLILKKKSGGKKETEEKVDELEKELEALRKKYKDQ
jgi:hypothetical protein